MNIITDYNIFQIATGIVCLWIMLSIWKHLNKQDNDIK